MYRPLNVTSRPKQTQSVTLFAKKGEDFRDLPQLLNTEFALKIQNYLIETDGQLVKRKGLLKIFEVAGTDPITMLEKFTSDIYIFGYGTTVAAYTFSTDTITTIKSDFSANDGFNGVRYGEFFFVCNGVEKIYRINNVLAETEITAAPICKVLKVIGPRLFAGNLSTDETAVAYSSTDDGTDPPFSTWTVGTDADDPGLVSYRNAGPVNTIESLGGTPIIWGDFGKWAFKIGTLDVGGTLAKTDQTVMSRVDFGGSASIETNLGIFYVNEAGLWQLVSVGQNDIKFSDQEAEVSQLLGDQFFDDLDFSSASMVYDAKKRTLFVTCARNSTTNNFVFAYNTEHKAFTEVTGWNINRFLNDDQTIYGGSSTNGKVYKCFHGSDDDGLPIGTEFYQELNVGALQTRKILKGLYVQGFLSLSTTLNVKFDIYDRTGRLITDKMKFEWTTQYNSNSQDGYGTASYGGSAYGGDKDFANTVESFDGIRPFIRNFQRLRVRITGQDKLPHIINWLSVETAEKARIRRRKLTKIT